MTEKTNEEPKEGFVRLTNKRFAEVYKSFQALVAYELPSVLSFNCARVLGAMKPDFDALAETEKKLFEKGAKKNETGTPVLSEGDPNYAVFTKDRDSLMGATVDIDLSKFKFPFVIPGNIQTASGEKPLLIPGAILLGILDYVKVE